jgi:hypothetical protein
VLEARNDLLDADRGDMQLGHVGRKIGIALVGADHDAARLRDREIASRHAGVGGKDQRTVGIPLRLRQIVHVAVVRIGADRPGKHLGDVGTKLVHRRHHHMARVLIVELLDALAQIGLDHLDSDRRHVVAETAFLGEHRLALDERRRAVIAENTVDGVIVLGSVTRPVQVNAVSARIGLEFLEVAVEMDERVLLDRRGERAQLLPFGNGVHLAVAFPAQIPEPFVVHLLVLGRGDETRRRFRLVDRPIAMDPGTARLPLRPGTQRLRGPFGVIEAVPVTVDRIAVHGCTKLRMEHGAAITRAVAVGTHALAPLSIWAIWMNLSGTPMRSAHPC